MSKSYKVLNKQIYFEGDFKLAPIRTEDRYKIMNWRNQQTFHLRQSEALTLEKQDWYFDNVIEKLFHQDQPDQILFSFFKKNEFIGYGGLVHVNWTDMNGEISLVLNTKFKNDSFLDLWILFLSLIKKVAFKTLDFHKIFTYAFDVRPNLYKALENSGFFQEARLKDHAYIDGKFFDVVYHAFINPKHNLKLKKADSSDCEVLFKWVNDLEVRKSSFISKPISWDEHVNWFKKVHKSSNTNIYIAKNSQNKPVGQVRIDYLNSYWYIDYSVDKDFRGLGLGTILIKKMISLNSKKEFLAKVKSKNIASITVFENLGFKKIEEKENLLYKYFK